jgi:acetolactate synthase-1/2/3 large subunit
MATSGPGATNLVDGDRDRLHGSSSVVGHHGQVPQAMIGERRLPGSGHNRITDPITKHNYLIQAPKDIASDVEQPFYLARTGRKGPVLLDGPKNIMTAEFSRSRSKKLVLEGYNPDDQGSPGQIKKTVKLLEQAKRPVIIAGGGPSASKASSPSARRATSRRSSLMGKSAFPNGHGHYLGLTATTAGWLPTGRCPRRTSSSRWANSDSATRSNRSASGPSPSKAQILHIDIRSR